LSPGLRTNREEDAEAIKKKFDGVATIEVK